MEKIEIFNYSKGNYNPVLVTNNWQVAYLNSCPEYELESIKKVDVHQNTDEVFVLLEGKAILIAAEILGEKIDFELIDMKKGITYNIPKGVWHNIVLFEDTRVFIVENAVTHISDFEFYRLKEKQVNQLRSKIDKILEQ